MKDRTILIIAGIALMIYFAARFYFSSRQDASFNATLIRIDTAMVSSILITPPGEQTDIVIRREGALWIASNGHTNIKAKPDAMNALLGLLTHIRIQAVATQKPSEWQDYNVQEQVGMRVRVYRSQELLEDFIIGKTRITPEGTTLSYLRLTGEDEVYAVTGSIARHLSLSFNDFRNNLILRTEGSINALDWHIADTLLQIRRNERGWFCGKIEIDSLKMANYLRSLRFVFGDVFADDFDEVKGEKLLFEKIVIFDSTTVEPFVLSCYRDTTRVLPFVIRSNQNTEAFFASDSLGVFHNLFQPLRDLLPLQDSLLHKQ